jgi:hypothetical protein
MPSDSIGRRLSGAANNADLPFLPKCAGPIEEHPLRSESRVSASVVDSVLNLLVATEGKASTDSASAPDPALVAGPNNSMHVFAWRLSSTRDAFGNLFQYTYLRDLQNVGPRAWDQLHLAQIRYADFGNVAAASFLGQVAFAYDGRRARPMKEREFSGPGSQVFPAHGNFSSAAGNHGYLCLSG